jgi:MFS family permease
LLAVLVLLFGIAEAPRVRNANASTGKGTARNPFAGFRRQDYSLRFWGLVGLVLLFTLTRFSEAFLILRAQDAGLPTGWAPMTLVVMSATYLLTAYPAGKLSDRMPRHFLLALGCVVMVAADLLLAFGQGVAVVMAGVALWGVHMGMTEGLVAALTADYAPADLRGTAFGIVNLARGLMLLVASALAGALWTGFGPQATFLCGAAFAVLTAAAALALRGQAHRG